MNLSTPSVFVSAAPSTPAPSFVSRTTSSALSPGCRSTAAPWHARTAFRRTRVSAIHRVSASTPPATMQALRFAQFLVLGSMNFTQNGYQMRSKHFVPGALDVDISSRRFMVTGANSGIGLAVAEELARRGADVHMICRDPARGEEARKHVAKHSAPSARVSLWVCDISSTRDVVRFVDEWKEKTKSSPSQTHPVVSAAAPYADAHSAGHLDCLINNAGAMLHTRVESAEGVEQNFAINVLGTYLLTELLIPSLVAAGGGRVVTVSSGGMLTAPGKLALDPNTMQGQDLVRTPTAGNVDHAVKIDGSTQYARNKRCQVALTEHWAKKYASSGIFWASMHPGWTSTPGLQKAMPEFHSFFTSRNSLRTVSEGADTVVWLAIADAPVSLESGLFFLDREPAPKHFWLAGTSYAEKDRDTFVGALNNLVMETSSVQVNDSL